MDVEEGGEKGGHIHLVNAVAAEKIFDDTVSGLLLGIAAQDEKKLADLLINKTVFLSMNE